MKELEIAFDLKGFQEYFIKYKKEEYKGKPAKTLYLSTCMLIY